MKSLIKILSVLTFFILSLNFVRAQTYPVLANVYIIPPYGSYLSDYYTSSREKLVVTLLNRDQQEPVLEAYLRMTVTSSTGLRIQNRPEINYPSITLDAGVPVRLSQEDLTPYFLPQNIVQQGYLNQGKLPNGMIEFTFQAIEKYTGKILSAPATGRIWLTTQKPPLLVFPNNHENVAFREPLNLKFQWQPQHNNISQVEYEFELREIPENGAAPQSAFLYSPIIHQERFFYTNFIYSAIHPMLDAGKTYGWRVRAIAKDGVDELNLFENNGYSEIFFFKSGSGCEPPVVTANVHDYQLDLTWQALDGASEYEVQFCNKYEGTGEWRKYITTNTNYTFYSLQLSSTYMYRVGTKCNNGSFVYGNVFEFKMPDVDSARLENCGMLPEIDLSNREPLQELNVGDVFMASDYPVTVTKVTNGSNGVFSGEGWIMLRWIFNTRMAVEFENLPINTDKRATGGEVNFKYNKDWKNVGNLDGSDGNNGNDGSGGIKSDITVDFVIPPNPEFEYNDSAGVLVIYDLSGTPHSIDLPKNSEGKVVFPVTIKDADGNVYEINEEIDENGNVTGKYVITQENEDDDMSAAETSNETENKIKFEVKSAVYNNNDTYTTIYNNKELRINILSDSVIDWSDLSVYIKNKKLTINEEKTDEDTIRYVSIQVNESNLKITNKLEVKSVKDKKTLSALKINTYNSPTVKFDRTGNNVVGHLFDKGFDEQNILKQKGEYKTIKIKGKDFYVPVLGVSLMSSATIKIDIDDFEEKIIKNDPNFKLIIKARTNNKISIDNNQDSLVLNYTKLMEIKSKGTITIMSNNAIDGENLTSMLIDVIVGETRDIVGQIEYYSVIPVNRKVTLIYTKFANSSSKIPANVDKDLLREFLNTESMNQLFVNFTEIDTLHFYCTLKESDLEKHVIPDNVLYDIYRNASTVLGNRWTPITIDNNRDYYFITNLDINISGNNYLSGAHYTGNKGGFSVKNHSVNETDYEIIAHEFGHWLGLPHTFEKPNDKVNFIINSSKGGTNHNFMDYNIRRKRWYKIQLINIIR